MIILKRHDVTLGDEEKVIITNEDEMTAQFQKAYEEQGGSGDKNDFFCDFLLTCPEPLNGTLHYNPRSDRIQFEYADWNTMCMYNHIELCIEWLERDKKEKAKYPNTYVPYFNRITMFHVLMALHASGALGTTEYEALSRKYAEHVPTV